MQSQGFFQGITNTVIDHFLIFVTSNNQQMINEMFRQYPHILFHHSIREELLNLLRTQELPIEIHQLLVEFGALIIATDANDQAVVEKLLESKVNTRIKMYDQSALHYAIMKNNPIITRSLIQNENDINFLIQEIFLTGMLGNLEILKLFIQHFPDLLNHVCHSGNTIGTELLVLAVDKGHGAIIDFLNKEQKIDLRQHNGMLSFVLQQKNDPTKIEKLIELGADVSKQDPETGLNILHYAVINDYAEVVKNLLESSVDVNMSSRTGMTAMMFCHSLRMAAVLMDAKINLRLEDENKNTALTFATLFVDNERNIIAREIVNLFKQNLNSEDLKIEKRCGNMVNAIKQMTPEQFNPFNMLHQLPLKHLDQCHSRLVETLGFHILTTTGQDLKKMQQTEVDPIMLRELGIVFLNYVNGTDQENIFEYLKKIAPKVQQYIALSVISKEACDNEKPSKLDKKNDEKSRLFDVHIAMHNILHFFERRFNQLNRIVCWHNTYGLLAVVLQKMELLSDDEQLKLMQVNLLENKLNQSSSRIENNEEYRNAIKIILDKMALQLKDEVEYETTVSQDDQKEMRSLTLNHFKIRPSS